MTGNRTARHPECLLLRPPGRNDASNIKAKGEGYKWTPGAVMATESWAQFARLSEPCEGWTLSLCKSLEELGDAMQDERAALIRWHDFGDRESVTSLLHSIIRERNGILVEGDCEWRTETLWGNARIAAKDVRTMREWIPWRGPRKAARLLIVDRKLSGARPGSGSDGGPVANVTKLETAMREAGLDPTEVAWASTSWEGGELQLLDLVTVGLLGAIVAIGKQTETYLK